VPQPSQTAFLLRKAKNSSVFRPAEMLRLHNSTMMTAEALNAYCEAGMGDYKPLKRLNPPQVRCV